MKPFLFSRGQKNYARFLIPTKYRSLCGGQKFLVFALGAGEGHIVRKKATATLPSRCGRSVATA